HLFYYLHKKHFREGVLGHVYANVLRESRVNLGFVSSSNLDEYTMRTFEIPACGAFMLAERTPTHLELFREGVEAEFFDSVSECAEKIRFYLRKEETRRRIADAGYRRCLADDYSLKGRMTEVLKKIESLVCEAPVHI